MQDLNSDQVYVRRYTERHCRFSLASFLASFFFVFPHRQGASAGAASNIEPFGALSPSMNCLFQPGVRRRDDWDGTMLQQREEKRKRAASRSSANPSLNYSSTGGATEIVE